MSDEEMNTPLWEQFGLEEEDQEAIESLLSMRELIGQKTMAIEQIERSAAQTQNQELFNMVQQAKSLIQAFAISSRIDLLVETVFKDNRRGQLEFETAFNENMRGQIDHMLAQLRQHDVRSTLLDGVPGVDPSKLV